jgi:glutamate synthase domain-containing protein 1
MESGEVNLEDGSDRSLQPPARQGLYDPANERDACGLGFIAHIKGQKTHSIVTQGLSILKNLTHRGATGADPLQGDGAGILIQLPDAFLRRACGRQGLTLPAVVQYGVGMVFLPKEPASRMACEQEIERAFAGEGQILLGWRDVPTDNRGLSVRTKEVEPVIRQVFIARGSNGMDQDALERKLYIIRKKSGHAIQALKLRHGKEFYVPSMSTRTLVYKGMLLAHQVGDYYRDLKDEHGDRARDGAPAVFRPTRSPRGPGASVPPRLPQRRSTRCAATSTGSALDSKALPARSWVTTSTRSGR